MFKMKAVSTTLAMAAICLLLSSTAQAQSGTPGKFARIYALIFKADWCANCRILGPKVLKVLPAFVPKGIIPIELDMTSEETTAKALAAAQKLGLRNRVEDNDGTGFVVLIDAKKKTKVGRITSNMTEDEMKAAFSKALARTGVKQ